MRLLILLLTFTLASPQKSARIVIDKTEAENVVLAAADLAGDIRKITGIELKTVRASKAGKGDVFIKTVSDGRWEAYSVRSGEDGVLRFTGSDARGTMFAIYDFCENYLKVDPMGYWNGTPCPKEEKLEWENVSIEQNSPSVKFRGWFINDEDLLTGWKPGGKRYTTVKFYQTVVAPEIMEHVAEALVRSRYNLIIPASLMWVLNPPEKELLDICAKRGVYLSMHHIEPLGVSAFGFHRYWEQKGKKYKFSYTAYPNEIEEVWKESVKAWSEYPNVIWQIGLRGAGDRPMWNTDKNIPNRDEAYAEIISGAMKRQVEILDEMGVPKENRIVSTTLWAEGSVFNNKGLLKIPEGTKIIFADNSPGWCWQDDFRSTVRRKEYGYGVYYHHALIGAGPHLASLIPAERTYSMMKQAYDSGAGDYAIFNVSDVREFSYNIAATSKMLWNMKEFNPEIWQKNWLSRHYSSRQDDWNSVYNAYYHCLQIHPGNKVPAFLDGQTYSRGIRLLNRMYKAVKNNPQGGQMAQESSKGEFPEDGSWDYRILGRDKKKDSFWKSMAMNGCQAFSSPLAELSMISAQTASYEVVMNRSEALYAGLPEEQKPFAYTTIVYPSTIMYRLSSLYTELLLMEDSYNNGNLPLAREHQAEALEHITAATDLEKTYCTGEFEGYWNTSKKLNLKSFRKMLAALRL